VSAAEREPHGPLLPIPLARIEFALFGRVVSDEECCWYGPLQDARIGQMALEANILPLEDDKMSTSFTRRTMCTFPCPSPRDIQASSASNIVLSGKYRRPRVPISSCSGTTRLHAPSSRGAYRPAWEEIRG
jgi:hypothetical protein